MGRAVDEETRVRIDPYHSTWRAARMLGGTLAAVCRKGGEAVIPCLLTPIRSRLHCGVRIVMGRFDATRAISSRVNSAGTRLRTKAAFITSCHRPKRRSSTPGDRDDVIDFSLPGHEKSCLTAGMDLKGCSATSTGGSADMLPRF